MTSLLNNSILVMNELKIKQYWKNVVTTNQTYREKGTGKSREREKGTENRESEKKGQKIAWARKRDRKLREWEKEEKNWTYVCVVYNTKLITKSISMFIWKMNSLRGILNQHKAIQSMSPWIINQSEIRWTLKALLTSIIFHSPDLGEDI